MERWKHDDPCALVEEFAQSIRPGLWLNLLVADIATAISFQTRVLGAEAVYQDDAFAIMRRDESFWLVHADKTYAHHPMADMVGGGAARGAGCEIRLQGCDPDGAEECARDLGFTVIAATADRPHGLREAFLQDPDGYVWVPSVPKVRSVQADAA